MSTFSATEARNEFKEILNRAAYGKERLRITSHGKVVAAMVPIEDLELLEELEDRLDREDAAAALAEAKAGMSEAGAVTLEEFQAGMDR